MLQNNTTMNELLLIISKKIDEMNKEIFFSINCVDLKILITLQREIIREHKNVGITFQIEVDKTNIYIYLN